ncbi:hypothetical protein PS15m_007348 [Mucor circinelloides]
MVTTRNKGISSNRGASTSSSTRAPSTTTSSPNSWIMVAKKRIKGKQRHVPFSPTTIIQPRVAISASSQALSSESSQPSSSIELVRPFIKSLERNSALINIITHIIKDNIALLEERLKQFNNADN